MPKLIILLTSVVISAAVVLSASLSGRVLEREKGSSDAVTSSQSSQDPPATVDGSVNPHVIPDEVAYELFFDFFSNRNASERNKLQAYCNQSALAGVNLDSIF